MTARDEVVIRASALSGYPDCPRRGAARLFWREIAGAGFELRRTARGIGAVIGTAVHRAAELTLREKATSGRLPPLTLAEDAAFDGVRNGLRDGDEVIFDTTSPTRLAAETQAIGMAGAYRRIIAPDVEPVLIEEPLEAEIGPGLVLAGRPDLVAREPGKIRDLKTTTRPGGSHAPQIGAYSLLARSHGLDIEAAAIDEARRVPIGKPQPDPTSRTVPIAAAETAATNIIRHITADLDVFRHGDPARHIERGDPWAFVANPNSMLCAAKYCPAWGTEFCREWQEK